MKLPYIAIEIFACILFLTAIALVLRNELRDDKWCQEQGYAGAKGKQCYSLGPEVKR